MDTATPSEVGLDELFAPAHFIRGALKESLALDQNMDAIADIKDETNIVVDEKDAQTPVPQRPDVIREVADLAFVEACCRLIEQDV
jgi:hypothetical protein